MSLEVDQTVIDLSSTDDIQDADGVRIPERASTPSARTTRARRRRQSQQGMISAKNDDNIDAEPIILCWDGEKEGSHSVATPSSRNKRKNSDTSDDDNVICLTDDSSKPPALLSCTEDDDIYVGDTLESMKRCERAALVQVQENVLNDVTYIETRQPDLVCLGSQPVFDAAGRSPSARMMMRNDRALAEELEDAEAGGEVPMRKRFKSAQIEKCSICLEESIAVWRGISLNNCQHEFCIECLAGYIKSKRGGHDISCPTPDCNAVVALPDIRYCLTENGDSEAWAAFQEQATLSFMEQKVAGGAASGGQSNTQIASSEHIGKNDDIPSVYRRCPAEHCNYIFEYSPYLYGSGCDFQCPDQSCRSRFCLDCGANGGQVGPSHPRQTCNDRLIQIQQQEEERRKLEAWKQENAQADTRFRDLVQQERSNGMSRTCPKCHELVTKNGGCDHMSCRCGHHFNWSQAK